MEILIGVFLIGIVILLLFFFSLPTTSRDQGEDTWDKWVEPYKNTKTPDYDPVENREKGIIMGDRGGRYEIRYSKKTGKPYRHYF